MSHIKIETGKVKDIRGHRIVGYYASLGDVRERAGSQTEAIAQLQARLASMAKSRSPQYRTFEGHTVIVCPDYDASGMTVLTVYPDGHVGTLSTNETDTNKLFDDARLHIAECIWDASDHTRAERAFSLVLGTRRESDFRSWVQFQTQYRAAIAEGHDSAEAHRLAICRSSEGLQHLE